MKKVNIKLLITGLFAIFLSLYGMQSIANEKGDLILRMGIVGVDPREDSSSVRQDGVAIPGSSAGLDSNIQPGLTLAYMLTDNIGIELLAATPFSQNIVGTGSLAGLDIGETKNLPPTLSLQYYFFEKESAFRPYVGIGVNYTTFFSEDLDSQFEAAIGTGDLSIDNSIGVSYQIGVDYNINDRWLINFGIWRVDIDTTAKIKLDAGPELKVDVDIAPWVYMLNVGYKF